MDNDTMNYITEYRRSVETCAKCKPGWTCISHTCLDCGSSHAPAAPCPVDMGDTCWACTSTALTLTMVMGVPELVCGDCGEPQEEA